MRQGAIRRIVVVVWLISSGSFVHSAKAVNEDALVKGASEFLLDRANANFVYSFQLELKSNQVFKGFFKNSYALFAKEDLRFLLLDKNALKRALNMDLVALPKQVFDTFPPSKITQQCKNDGVSEVTCNDLSKMIEDLRVSIQNAAGCFRDADQLARSVCLKRVPIAALAPNLNQHGDVPDGVSRVAMAGNELKTALSEGDFGATVRGFFDLIESLGYYNKSIREMIEQDSDYAVFRRYASFLVRAVDDSLDSSQVKALLATMTLPDVSFGVKRENNNYKWLVTSYLGGSYQHSQSANGSSGFGMSAPVGLEVAWGRRGLERKCEYKEIVDGKCLHSSLSVMISPLDFGVPIARKMAGQDATARFSDIIAPGAYVVYGMPRYPLAIGLGFVRSKSLKGPSESEKRFVLFFAFDLPLFALN